MLDVVDKGQQAVTSWGKLLMATGGDLNPEKCNWTLHDMVAKEDGTWDYKVCKPAASTVIECKVLPGIKLEPRAEGTTNDIDDMQMTVPQTDGSNAPIDQLQSCQAVKNLGLYAPPDGSTEPQFSALRERVDEWTNNVANSGLPTRSVWKSYQFQLWSGMKYGIGATPAMIKELENGLGTRDHKLLDNPGEDLKYSSFCQDE